MKSARLSLLLSCVGLLFGVAAESSVSASDWASELFKVRSHNFGTVARAAKTEYSFDFKNTTGQNIHISHVRASCGCTTPIVPNQTIAPGEEGAVIARLNTGSFLGQRGATLTVVFTQPSYREVQLRVDGYVRRDIVCNPGEIDFGKVTASEKARCEVDIQYAGRNDWQIKDVVTDIPGLSFELVETRRDGGRVGYSLTAEWTATGAGYLQSDVILVTNDGQRPKIPLAVEGQAVSLLQVSPVNVFLGQVESGSTTTKRVIVRADEPFRIKAATCDDARVKVNFEDVEKKLQMLELTFAAGDQAGEFDCQVSVQTDAGENASTSFTVSGVVGQSLAAQK